VSDPKNLGGRVVGHPPFGVSPSIKNSLRKGETPEEGVSHEGDGEVGRDFYRRAWSPPRPSKG